MMKIYSSLSLCPYMVDFGNVITFAGSSPADCDFEHNITEHKLSCCILYYRKFEL